MQVDDVTTEETVDETKQTSLLKDVDWQPLTETLETLANIWLKEAESITSSSFVS